MANNFMKNVNKVSLDGEVVSFSNTFPIVDVKEDVVEIPIVEETVVETNDVENDVIEETEDKEITEPTEETTEEIDDEE